ncbi:MAG TPA: hypothetical protein VLX28_14405 [Thermoanaerobaculia bacterium]|nr:hypothetical protein [Thermoanaerobaculia bacterium]
MLELSQSTAPPPTLPLFDPLPAEQEPSAASQGNPPSDPPDPPQVATDTPSYEWEKRLAFRNTFLLHFTQPGDRELLERLGNLWFEMALECADKWPDWPDGATRCEMRAAAQDLRHTAEYLASVGHERYVSSLDLEDERLSLMAERWAVEADRIAAEINALLASRLPDRREDG